TAARHFVSLLNDKTPLATRLGIPQAEVKIKFVGVFDTVSSYGFTLTGFGSDVAELGLDLAGVPEKVVHLAAANEYRENFSLTDITSSLQVGKGYELVLPGVHSNIGGSYGEITNEEERHLLDAECQE
ncbi:phospholipase effector Tle1 domain-containing protein, partial [Hymenobacter terrenus]|uniref:phospholipase effector Tle1 domain-containing protein n=1 Tax=Hymenobacter terrenus TaxID=1629124 RepID=UPI0006196ABD